MTEEHKTRSAGRADRPGRQGWSSPKLTRIEAVQAELGFTPAVGDGNFTTS